MQQLDFGLGSSHLPHPLEPLAVYELQDLGAMHHVVLVSHVHMFGLNIQVKGTPLQKLNLVLLLLEVVEAQAGVQELLDEASPSQVQLPVGTALFFPVRSALRAALTLIGNRSHDSKARLLRKKTAITTLTTIGKAAVREHNHGCDSLQA